MRPTSVHADRAGSGERAAEGDHLVVTSVLAVGQHHLERYYARGYRPGGVR